MLYRNLMAQSTHLDLDQIMIANFLRLSQPKEVESTAM